MKRPLVSLALAICVFTAVPFITTAGAYQFARKSHHVVSGQASTDCTDVHFITRGEASKLPEPYGFSVVDPKPSQKLAAKLAMSALPELLCKAVEGIAFVDTMLPKGAKAMVSSKAPDLVIVCAKPGFASESDLNVKFTSFTSMPTSPANRMTPEERSKAKLAADLRAWSRTIQAITHESGHNATYLIDSITDAHTVKDVWDPDAVAAAKEAIQRTRIKAGLAEEWGKLNGRFEEVDLAGDYDGSRLQDASAPAPKGFMTVYAGHDVLEDIAETESWMSFKLFQENFTLGDITTLDLGVYPDLKPQFEYRTACEDLQKANSQGIPGGLAAIYTKMNFIVDLGFATQEAFDHCIGNGKVGLKRLQRGTGLGFQVFDGENWNIINEYDKQVTYVREADKIKIGARNVIKKNGKEYPAILGLEIAIDPGSMPRGVYKISKCNKFPLYVTDRVRPASDAMFTLDVAGVRSNSFCAYNALVLVSRATRRRMEGAVVLQKLVKFSAPPVPEKPKYPVQYTFVLRSSR